MASSFKDIWYSGQHVCVWIGGRGLRPHTKGHLPLQISELKNHSVLQALTAEANGWEPGGKVPFGAHRAWVGLKAEHVGLSFPPLNFFPWISLTTFPIEFYRFILLQGKLELTLD